MYLKKISNSAYLFTLKFERFYRKKTMKVSKLNNCCKVKKVFENVEFSVFLKEKPKTLVKLIFILDHFRPTLHQIYTIQIHHTKTLNLDRTIFLPLILF